MEAEEELNGIRFSWNVIPSTAEEAKKSVIPIGAMYQPLFDRPDLTILSQDPVLCRNEACRAILNPYCMIDSQGRSWICRFCHSRNPLPKAYEITSQETLPPELLPQNTTIEYVLNRKANAPLVFMFVVDVCQDEENLQALKDTLLVSLSLLPPDSLVGLISFGTNVHIHELGYSDCSRTLAFNGKKTYSSKQIQEVLGFLSPDLRVAVKGGAGGPYGGASAAATMAKYLLPLSDAEFSLTNTIEQLQRDSFSVKSHNRPLRSTGLALDVAISILETALPHTGSRILLFSAGPCTNGPGLVVGCPHKEAIRSHHDIIGEAAPHYKPACKFYETLSRRASKNGIVADIFAGSYDQIGLDEMKPLCDHTGGFMVLADAFTTSIFKQSFLRIFNKNEDGNLSMGLSANLEVKLSQELRVSGLIGHAVGQNNKSGHVAETAVGIGGTSSWKLCGVSPRSTYAIYFDSVNTKPPQSPPGTDPSIPPQTYIQFITHYQHSSGYFRLRVTTVGRSLSQPGGSTALKQSFDQEAAAALMGRMAVYRLAQQNEQLENIILWLDATLIKMCKHFGEYVRDNPSTFKLIPEMGYYFPQFIYHLRRGQFLQVFNNSPDETAYYRHVLLTEDTNNTTVMIQPTLTAYSIANPNEGTPVLLDSTSLTPDRVLLLDSFFHLLIYHGETIAAWKKAGYQDLDEYANFKELLQQPRKDASELLIDRFPLPRFIETEAKGSQARFLMARLNPTRSTMNSEIGVAPDGSAVVLTDDVSLQNFMDYLIKYSVSSKNKV